MSYTLAVESIGRSGSVAAVSDDGSLIRAEQLGTQPAAAHLVPLINEVLNDCGRPSRLAWAAGPGSFTGLRISAVCMRTLAWTDDLPLCSVPSLAALACQQGDGCWWTLLPLKKDTTFHAAYEVKNGIWEELIAPQAVDDADLPAIGDLAQGLTAVGPALTLKPEAMARWCRGMPQGNAAVLEAPAVADAARGCTAEHWSAALPNYHRKSAPELQRGL